MFSYLKTLFGKRRLAAPQSKPRTPGRIRLEVLEDRQVPAFLIDPLHSDHLIVKADSPNDTFAFTDIGGTLKVTLTTPGQPVPVKTADMTGIDKISFAGWVGGSNRAFLTDTTGFHTLLSLGTDVGTMQGANYALDVSGMPTIYAYGDANGRANLYGSPVVKNTYVGTPTLSWMSNAVSNNWVHNFGIVTALGGVYAGAGTPADVAYLYGSTTSQNHFVGTAQGGNVGGTRLGGIMFSTNWDGAGGFLHITAYAVRPDDIADFRGSTTSHNVFVDHPAAGTTPALSSMTDGNYSFQAQGFRWVGALAGKPGDVAQLFGSTTSKNVLTYGPNAVALVSSVHSVGVDGFTEVSAYKGTNLDVAYLGPTCPSVTVLGHTDHYLKVQGPNGPWWINAWDFPYIK
jgi:hypothetical protein